MSSKDVVIVNSAFCLPYRDWEAKALADATEDATLVSAGYKVERVSNTPDEIDAMIEMVKVSSPLAIVFETDIGTWLEKGYEKRKGKVLKKLKPIAEGGVKVLSMNNKQLSEKDAEFIVAIDEPSMFGSAGHGATILEYLSQLE